jgi:predicted ATPase/DNA-binding SARP family transcriptional activator
LARQTIGSPTNIEFAVLGPLELRRDGELLQVRAARQRSLLVFLLLHANEAVSTDRLVDSLWAEEPPGGAVHTLQVYVSQLRKLLGREVLITQPPGYLLRLEAEALDAERFTAALAEGREQLERHRTRAAAESLRAALALWRGPALADFHYEPWAQAEIGRLEDLRLVCLEARIEAELELGEHVQLVGELEALIAEQPLRERPRGQLMLALYRSGRQTEALESYQRARRTFSEEVGIDPSPELQALQRMILTQDESLSLPIGLAGEWRLPAPPSPLIGRARELDELALMLRRPDARLLTLVGPGGTGKTRLAIAAAAAAEPDFARGAAFVSLAELTDSTLVLEAIARELDVQEVAEEELAESLGAALRDQELLLVLDNFEHVLEAAAHVGELLSAAPDLKVVVTSRIVLHLSGEHEYPVEPLVEADAVELFRQRAGAADRDFTLDERVPEICNRLDRLPLALELAAARIKVLSSEELLERLAERLSLLTGGARDLPERQRTLRATLEWSYELLEQHDQRLFARLAVFVGGCTREAATRVCGADIDGLGSLVDKSLLRVRDGRFEMLETIREYASECLQASREADQLAQDHAAYVRDLVEEIEPELVSSADAETLAGAAAERSNVLAALERAEPATRLRIAGAFWRYWLLRGHLTEGRSCLEDALAAAPDAPALVLAKAHRGAGILAHRQGDYQRAREYLESSLSAYADAGDIAQVARATSNLGNIAVAQGAYEEASQLFDRAATLAGDVGDQYVAAAALSNAADLAETLGDYGRAEELARRSVPLLRAIGDEQATAVALQNLGSAELRQGRPDEARSSLLESLEISHRIGATETVAYALESLGELEVAQDNRRAAAHLLGLAQRLREELGLSMRPTEKTIHDRLIESLGGAAFDEIFAEGSRRDLDQTVAGMLEGRRPVEPAESPSHAP